MTTIDDEQVAVRLRHEDVKDLHDCLVEFRSMSENLAQVWSTTAAGDKDVTTLASTTYGLLERLWFQIQQASMAGPPQSRTWAAFEAALKKVAWFEIERTAACLDSDDNPKGAWHMVAGIRGHGKYHASQAFPEDQHYACMFDWDNMMVVWHVMLKAIS